MLTFRIADVEDVDLLYHWASDEDTRKNSYNSDAIKYDNHVRWFHDRLKSSKCRIYIFSNLEKFSIGQVRIELGESGDAIIGVSIAKEHRGKNYSSQMINLACEDFFTFHDGVKIKAWIFTNNQASYRSFLTAGFRIEKEEILNGIASFLLSREK